MGTAAIKGVLDAADSGSLDDVAKFVQEKSGDINSVHDEFNRTLLHCLVGRPATISQAQQVLTLCETCISKGADVNASTKSGVTPLHVAAQAGNVAACKLLLNKGAKVDAIQKTGDTPLLLAIQLGREDAVHELMMAGADPAFVNSVTGLSALDYAKQKAHTEIAENIEFTLVCVYYYVFLT